ncbi:YeeE/YedE family protein [Sediminicoccus sp. KRV36]|uniref:YeeE/YedE family protein n=1 Tax=Sediminicoccus sp. KRV36 TaxID=3133721 RepID=UPI00200E6391|nr:YeeE/YedE family protein [Sediminicoccus rosea]UPY37368.1 YeeE/YedE family protein [Sediminicoccus rosea]
MMRSWPGLLLLTGGAAWLWQAQGGRMAALWLVGAALGLTLFQSSFSFAGAFRRLLAERRGAGLRAQLVLLGLACCLSLPVIEAGALFGQPVRGFVFPVGWGLLLGAFLFGIGMQLGGGCASGTLTTAAGGQGARMWVTLATFIAGATFAAYDAERWMEWPALAPISLLQAFGAWPALVISLGMLGLAWAAALWVERRRHGLAEPLAWRGAGLFRFPWPPLWGAVGLAALGFATLLLAGRPWAITAAFPLWGSRAIAALGWDEPAFWPYWEDPTRTEALLRPLLADRMTVMDLGLMAGAFLAAGLAGRRGAWGWPRPRPALASLLGGLLLGYGAVLAFGCNISAFLGGILSGSLHGWVWIIPALIGNAVGITLRPAFHLEIARH